MIEVNNLSGSSLGQDFFKKIAKKVLKGERKTKKDISVALVEQKRIKELNKKYRGKNRPTDVLSFQYDDSGEIVISPKEVKENARKFASTYKKELARVLIHGLLHLSGYDHGKSRKEKKRMEEKEDHYLKLCQKLI